MRRRQDAEWSELGRRMQVYGYRLEHAIPAPVINKPGGGFIAILEGRVVDVDSARRFVEQLERGE